MTETDATFTAGVRDTTEGPVYTVSGQDWDAMTAEIVGNERVVVNMGPQHPSTHGVLRVAVKTDGEVVLDCEPMIGNLHRCKEKIAENLQYWQFMPYTDRLDYLAPLANNCSATWAFEKVCGIKAPPRAEGAGLLRR